MYGHSSASKTISLGIEDMIHRTVYQAVAVAASRGKKKVSWIDIQGLSVFVCLTDGSTATGNVFVNFTDQNGDLVSNHTITSVYGTVMPEEEALLKIGVECSISIEENKPIDKLAATYGEE